MQTSAGQCRTACVGIPSFGKLVLESHIGIPEDPESIYHAVDCVDCAAKSELDGALNQAATCTCIVRFVLAWR